MLMQPSTWLCSADADPLIRSAKSRPADSDPPIPNPRAELFWRLGGQRDFLHFVADLDLVDHGHPFDHAAEDRVLSVEGGLRFEADIELAAAGLAIRIDRVAQARRRDRAAEMLFGGADLGGNVVAGAAAAVTLGIAALDHEARDHAMEGA